MSRLFSPCSQSVRSLKANQTQCEIFGILRNTYINCPPECTNCPKKNVVFLSSLDINRKTLGVRTRACRLVCVSGCPLLEPPRPENHRTRVIYDLDQLRTLTAASMLPCSLGASDLIHFPCLVVPHMTFQ